jgi:mannosylglycerate hydrolase
MTTRKDSSHIKKIKVVSNTHWDREFRRSFEKTRRNLLIMMDTTLEILDKIPGYHSFTLDGHSILLDDYLEMRPEKRPLVEKLIQTGKLVAGPYYTLAEEFSIAQEPMVRNLIWGRKTVEKYGGKTGTVAYTPSSWGQTGQLPQIVKDFGLDKMMFYRGISHHEANAEYIWSAPDGTKVLASRFAIYARYNWYYQVHRAVTRGKVFDKTYNWGEYDEIPLRFADSISGFDPSFDLKDPAVQYDKTRLKKAVEDMVEREGSHFTTNTFLAMNGHDISVAHPLEAQIISDAKEIFKGKYEIEHCSLEEFWKEAEKQLDQSKMTVLTGERRAYLKEGMWTFLFPSTISARTYLKQQDFKATSNLVYTAEPFASLAFALGDEYPAQYLNRGWQYLLSNHTHDANGGCAPDAVCKDMEYRYRKVNDIADIVAEDAITHIVKNLSPENQSQDNVQLVVFNSLPFSRDAVVKVDLEMPKSFNAKSVDLIGDNDKQVQQQSILTDKSSVFIDNIWEVPTILDSTRIISWCKFNNLPALGYRTYQVKSSNLELRSNKTLVTGPDSMENKFIKVKVNQNGTVNIVNKGTGKKYQQLNYLTDQGEAGNAWQHIGLRYDKKYNSLGMAANIAVSESGVLVSTIAVDFKFSVPSEYVDGVSRSEIKVEIPVNINYTLEENSKFLKVAMTINNTAKDHWLRVNFPTQIETEKTWSDSHFDVLSRDIKIPDSTGWAEEAQGTHPLRTFVDLNDSKNGLAILTKGLFEYEAFEDQYNTLAVTLLRACRIKLKVSEEKITELRDEGIQCPGVQHYEYAIYPHSGDCFDAEVLNMASEYNVPVRAVMSSRGKGSLPLEGGLFAISGDNLQVTAVKNAEDGSGLIIRLYNPADKEVKGELSFQNKLKKASFCRMDESEIASADYKDSKLALTVACKKIITLKVNL